MFKDIFYNTISKISLLLFSRMCKQTTFKKNERKRKPELVGWNTKRKIFSLFHKKTKKPNKKKTFNEMFFMWFKKLFIRTSYRLQQKKFQFKQFSSIMSKLSLQNTLQQIILGESIVKKVKKIPRDKYTYNIDVKDNHNYFANNMLVHNCIIDESCLISQEVYASKIHRMLIKSPNARVIMIGNPWHKKNFFYEYYLDPKSKRIHIDYIQALKEDRIAQQQVDEAKRLNTPIHFQVLYKSEFPSDSDFQLIPENHIKRAKNKKLKKNIGFVIASLDVASMGDDLSVLTLGRVIGNKLFVYKILNYSKKNPADLSLIVKSVIDSEQVQRIYVDATGIGEGVYANLNNFGYDAIAIKAGGKPTEKFKYTTIKQMFRYKKDELYWMLRTMFENNRIYFSYDIDKHELDRLTTELLRIEWTIDISKGLTRILDDKKSIDGRVIQKSPDYADSMAYMCCEFVSDYYINETVLKTSDGEKQVTIDPYSDNPYSDHPNEPNINTP